MPSNVLVDSTYLICNHQDAVFLAYLLGKRKELAVHVDGASITLDRLKHECGHSLRSLAQNCFLQLPRCIGY